MSASPRLMPLPLVMMPHWGFLIYPLSVFAHGLGNPEAVPDLAVVATGMADTLEQLGADVT